MSVCVSGRILNVFADFTRVLWGVRVCSLRMRVPGESGPSGDGGGGNWVSFIMNEPQQTTCSLVPHTRIERRERERVLKSVEQILMPV